MTRICRSAVGVVLLLGLSVSSFAQAWNYYGVIAWSPSTNRWGYATNALDLYSAQRVALNGCGLWDCRVAVQVQNGCASFAVGANAGYGWAIGVNRAEVFNRALYNCSATTWGCGVLASVCTSPY